MYYWLGVKKKKKKKKEQLHLQCMKINLNVCLDTTKIVDLT